MGKLHAAGLAVVQRQHGFRNFLAVKLQGVDWIHVPKNAVMRKLAHITEFTLLGIVLTGIIKA